MRKLDLSGDDWRMASLQCIGRTGDVMVEVSRTRAKTRGPDKGGILWYGDKPKAAVTRREYDEERARWEAETGLCGDCGGSRQVCSGFDQTEMKYRSCKRCAERTAV